MWLHGVQKQGKASKGPEAAPLAVGAELTACTAASGLEADTIEGHLAAVCTAVKQVRTDWMPSCNAN